MMVARCKGQKLIVYSFRVDGKLIPLGHLKRILPKGILWDGRDDEAYMIQNNNSDIWWTRAITTQEEVATLQTLMEGYEGPPGSVSIPGAQSSLKGKIANFLEVVDPRGSHRRGASCYGIYYNRWIEEESGQHFFDWLDFGPGSRIFEEVPEKPYCVYPSFTKRSVHYFDDHERLNHEIYLVPSEDGSELFARYKVDDRPVPESDVASGGHLYIWDLNRTLLIVDNTWDKKRFGIVKHSGVMAGQPALSGGEAYFGKNGRLWGINYASGHYHPTVEAVSMMYQWVLDMGWNVTAFHWIGRKGKDGKESWSTKKCDEIDWKRNQIHGYDATALRQSCGKVTNGPTWMLMYDD